MANVHMFVVCMAAFGLYVLARDKCIHDFVDVDLVRLFNYGTFYIAFSQCLILNVSSIQFLGG